MRERITFRSTQVYNKSKFITAILFDRCRDVRGPTG